MAFIYKITNLQNQKIYVGKTILPIENRWKQHIKDSQREHYEKRPLYDAINKYGIKNFSVEQLEECLPEELNQKEQEWIAKLNSYENGYNATKGGDGKFLIDYDEVVKIYQEVGTVKETAKILNIDYGWTSKILKNKGFINLTQNCGRTQKKQVAKIDPKTNEILEIYDSIEKAEQATGNSRHIASVCQGKRKTCKGFKWRYVE